MQTITYLLYLTGWRVVRLLPERLAYRLFDAIADRVARRQGRQVARLRQNLAIVTGLSGTALEQLTREGMRSYLRYWCDAFRLPDWSKERTLATTTVVGEEHLVSATKGGRGAVVSLPHSGNWDHAGAWATHRGWKVVTVAEVLRPERLFRRFLDYRARLGFLVYPFGAPHIMQTLTQQLQGGGLIALVSDRDLSHSGVPVRFFGGQTKMPRGPAALALATGSALLPAHVAYNDHGIVVTFYPPVTTGLADRDEAIADLTQKVAEQFESAIRAHPQDWHMLQRVWVD